MTMSLKVCNEIKSKYSHVCGGVPGRRLRVKPGVSPNYSGRGRAFPWSRSTPGWPALARGRGWHRSVLCPFRQTGSQSAELTLGSWSIRVNTHTLVHSQSRVMQKDYSKDILFGCK